MMHRTGTRLSQPRLRPKGGEPAGDAAPFDAGALLGALVGAVPGLQALTVHGGGFRDALVHDGDVILWQRDAEVRPGELAAVRIRGDSAIRLRRVFLDGDEVRLEPENRLVPSTTARRCDVRIQGRVVAIARRDPASG